MNVTLLCHGPLESLPPLVNTSFALRRMGVGLRVAASTIEEKTNRALATAGVEAISLCAGEEVSRTPINRIGRYVGFHLSARRLIRNLPAGEVLWIGSAVTAAALGPVLRGRRYVLQIHELYDVRPVFRRVLSSAIRQAAVLVVPERTRADIVAMWYGLARTPIVLPNKPLAGQYERAMPIADPVTKGMIESLAGSKIVLYQGMIHPDRDLRPLARAIHEMGSGWTLVLMGKDWGVLEQVRAECPALVHFPYVLPPEHLTVTSHAHIGVITYTPTSLNHLFCAPNKLWEFAAFGVPTLCDDLPSLREALGASQAGVVTRFREIRAVQSSLLQIASHYADYSAKAAAMFAAMDESRILTNVMEQLNYA